MTKITDICEAQYQKWPLGWHDAFGGFDFFFVRGMREAFNRRGFGNSARMNRELVRLLKLAPDYVPADQWLRFYPGEQKLSVADLTKVLNDNGLSAAGSTVRLKMLNGDPVSFAKPMYVLGRLASIKDNPLALDIVKNAEIHLANCYVIGLRAALSHTSETQREAMFAKLGGPAEQWRISEMLNGFPVTREYAEALTTYLSATPSVRKKLKGDLAVGEYQDRDAVRKAVLTKTGQNSKLDTMRVALPTPQLSGED